MQNNSFIQKGKKSRNELFLPSLRYVVVDDWVSKIGNEAFVSWLKLHSWVDRRDEEREHDRIPYTLEDTAKKLGMSKSKLYRTVIIPLWEHWLIDLVEYEASNRKSQKPKNIIVYESPQNKHETEIKPLEKLRDWKKDYGSPSQFFGRRGGRPKSTNRTDVHRFKNETVDGFKNETVTVSKMKPNNVSNNLITNQINSNNEPNHHHPNNRVNPNSKNIEISSNWNDDDDYVKFRNLFLSEGADDIKRHDLHYKKFEVAKKKIGLHKLLEAARTYICVYKENSQIVPFLVGGYNQYLSPPESKKLTNANIPQAIKKAQQADEEQAVTIDSDQTRWKNSIAEKLALWEAKKRGKR